MATSATTSPYTNPHAASAATARENEMTKQELLDLLARAKECDGDPEAAHGMADDALINFINDPDVATAFDSINKWYA